MRSPMMVMALSLAGSMTLVSPALASDGENAVSVSLGYGTYIVPDESPSGGVLGLAYKRGFSEAMAWRISGGGGVYYGAGAVSYSGHATVGFTYLLDVLTYVPYVEAGLGAITIIDDGGVDVAPLVQVGVGLDILQSRTFSYGVRLEFESLLQETSFFHAAVRGTWRWGYF